MITIGCDPGGKGGFCWNEPGRGVVAVKMPEGEAAVIELIAGIVKAAGAEPIRFYIELVTGYVRPQAAKIGTDGQPEKSKFSKLAVPDQKPFGKLRDSYS